MSDEIKDTVVDEEVIEVVAESNLPDLIIEIPEASDDIDISEWCSNTKRILGKKYNVIFIDPQEQE